MKNEKKQGGKGHQSSDPNKKSSVDTGSKKSQPMKDADTGQRDTGKTRKEEDEE
jgi:hypothetical protein